MLYKTQRYTQLTKSYVLFSGVQAIYVVLRMMIAKGPFPMMVLEMKILKRRKTMGRVKRSVILPGVQSGH